MGIQDKEFEQFLTKMMHDEVHDLTNIISLIDLLYKQGNSKISKEDLLLLKVYFGGRMGLITMEIGEDGTVLNDILYKVRNAI